MLRKVELYGTTATTGALTVTSSSHVLGALEAARWIDGTFADNVTATLSMLGNGIMPDIDLIVWGAGEADDDGLFHGYTVVKDNGAATVTFDGTNEIYGRQIVDGQLKLVVAAGGDTKVGGCVVYIDEF